MAPPVPEIEVCSYRMEQESGLGNHSPNLASSQDLVLVKVNDKVSLKSGWREILMDMQQRCFD